MRKILAIILIVTFLSSVLVGQVQAWTSSFDGEWSSPKTWSVHAEVTIQQITDELKKGLDWLADLLTFKVKTPKAGAFKDIDMLLQGWSFTTDGVSYLNLTAPAPINQTGDYYICDIGSVYNGTTDYNQFTWMAIGVNGLITDSGNVLFMNPKGAVGGVYVTIDRFSLLAPYIGSALAILAAAVALPIYVKSVKRRKEKQ